MIPSNPLWLCICVVANLCLLDSTAGRRRELATPTSSRPPSGGFCPFLVSLPETLTRPAPLLLGNVTSSKRPSVTTRQNSSSCPHSPFVLFILSSSLDNMVIILSVPLEYKLQEGEDSALFIVCPPWADSKASLNIVE